MRGEDPAPVGDGDTRSWFRYYKWEVEGENFVPKKYPFLEAEGGDFVWFVMDGKLWGGAPVLRATTPPLQVQRQEIWYNADAIVEFDPPAICLISSVGPDLGAAWVNEAKKRK
jgi:hypothetical protein